MTGSVTGIDGCKELLDYSMTKGGIHAFTRSLAAQPDRGHSGERGRAWPGLDAAQPRRQTAEESRNSGQTPMKRPAQPEEIAPAFVFLASPQLLQLHHRRNPADHRRLFGRLGDGIARHRGPPSRCLHSTAP